MTTTRINREFLFAFALCVMAIVVAFLAVQLRDIRSSRFTTADGLRVWTAIDEPKLIEIERRIAELEAELAELKEAE